MMLEANETLEKNIGLRGFLLVLGWSGVAAGRFVHQVTKVL